MQKVVTVFGLTCPCEATTCEGVLKNNFTGKSTQLCLYPDLKEAQKAKIDFTFGTGQTTEVKKYRLVID